MSEAQRIIAKHYENLCKDLLLDPMELESSKEVYADIKYIVYERMYDYSTAQDIGLEDHELKKLKADYEPNKYEIEYNKY